MNTNDVFQNLSESEVKKKYEEYKKLGLSEDDIFNEIYAEDCNMD